LDPYYKVFFGDQEVELTADFDKNAELFETFEKGGGQALKAYMEQSTYKYDVAMEDFLYRDYKHIGQFFNRRLMTEGLKLGVLYFAKDWNGHFDDIFKQPSWPDQNPCFYISSITKTDPSSAPQGCENVFLLVPVAPGLADTDEQREAYFAMMVEHVKKVTGEDLDKDVMVKRLYTHRDFIQDYQCLQGHGPWV